MPINETLLEETMEDYDDLLYHYGCDRLEAQDFLLTAMPFLHRQKQAIEMVETILVAHGKERLLRLSSDN